MCDERVAGRLPFSRTEMQHIETKLYFVEKSCIKNILCYNDDSLKRK